MLDITLYLKAAKLKNLQRQWWRFNLAISTEGMYETLQTRDKVP